MSVSAELKKYGPAAGSNTLDLSQYFAIEDSDPSTPEEVTRCKVVLVEMLRHTILDMCGKGLTGKAGTDHQRTRNRLQREAIPYAESDNEQPFSFNWILQQLGVDKKWLMGEFYAGRMHLWESPRRKVKPKTVELNNELLEAFGARA